MKVRDSGMPEQAFWESLLDVTAMLDALRLDRTVRDAVELGCGYGTFTVPVAQRVAGTLHAFDIEPEMVELARDRVKQAKLGNAHVVLRDVIKEGFGLAPASIDAVLLFNILHAEQPVQMLRSSAELLRPGGRVLVIHWRSDIPTPRGPDLSIRPKPEQIAAWGTSVGLRPQQSQLLPPWHFGIVLDR